jgi:hypothetical protein
MFGYRYMFFNEQMKTWTHEALGGSFMPSTTLQLPIKTWTAGKWRWRRPGAASG